MGDLKTTGETLLAFRRQGRFSLVEAPVDERALEACVEELRDDESILQAGLLTADLSHVAAAFAPA